MADDEKIYLQELSGLAQPQYELDRAEAGPKLPVDEFNYRGISVSSRFSVAHEFETMKRVIDALPDLPRARVGSIWCDSRAQAWWQVVVRSGRWAEGLDDQVRRAFFDVTDGFNGLTIEGDGHHAHFDAEWWGDWEGERGAQ